MVKNKKPIDKIDEINDSLKKILILKMFEMNVPQVEIAKRVHTDLNAVNSFLKGINKQK